MSKDLNQLALKLSLCSSGSEEKSADLMNYMLRLMCKGQDLSPVAGEVIKLLALPYPPLKNVICTYLIRYSANVSDLNILAANTLLSDFADPNPYVRKLVIRTTCSIPRLHELALKLLPEALCDQSSYVRCSAAAACSLVINETNLDSNQDIIDMLYEKIRDPECSVVVSSLSALEEILKREGGIVINSRIADYLMSRFLKFSDWDFMVVCSVLKKYTPKNIKEVLCYLQVLDEKLRDRSPAVFISVTELALHFVNKQHKNLTKDIIKQLCIQIELPLRTLSAEHLIAFLEVLEGYIPQHIDIFSTHYKLFLCRFCDATLVKVKKLTILKEMVNSDNCSEIMDEILLHCSDGSPEVSKQAVKSFISVIKRNPSLNNYMKTFVQLMHINHNNLSEEILKVLSLLNLNDTLDVKETVLLGVSKHFHKITSVGGKKALLRILSNYATDIDQSPYIVQELINELHTFEVETMMSELLSTSIKIFLHRPAEMQLFLGQFLQSAKNSNNFYVKKQASVYYQLLKNVKVAQEVININKINKVT